MKKIALFAAISMAVCYALIAQQQEGTYSKEYIPTPGSEEAAIITKRIAFYDLSGRLERIMHYLTEEASVKYGASIQIDHYSESGKITSHTMYFTTDYQEITGFSGRIDHEDGNNNVIGIEFFIDKKSIYYAGLEELKFFDKYPPVRMQYYYEENKEPLEDENHYVYEAPLIGGTTYVEYLNRIENIPAKEKKLISGWANMRKAEYFEKVYNKRVLVREKGKELWVCFQDELLPFLRKDTYMILRYYYIGYTIEGPTFLVTYIGELN